MAERPCVCTLTTPKWTARSHQLYSEESCLFQASKEVLTLQHTIQLFRKSVWLYLFPDLSCDKGRIDDYHIKCLMQVRWDIFGLIEIVEHIARVFIELLIKLYKKINSRTNSLHRTLWRCPWSLYSLESNRWRESRERRCVCHKAHTRSPWSWWWPSSTNTGWIHSFPCVWPKRGSTSPL